MAKRRNRMAEELIRAKFEETEWNESSEVVSFIYKREQYFARRRDGVYLDTAVNARWNNFQKGLAAAVEEAINICDEIADRLPVAGAPDCATLIREKCAK